MQSDKFPIAVLNSMETHIQYLRVAMKNYTLQELVESQMQWEKAGIPIEYKNLVKEELKYRESLIQVRRT